MEAERRAAMVLRSIVVLLLADTDLALAVVYYFDWARALSTCSSRRLVKRGIHGCIFSARSHIFLSILIPVAQKLRKSWAIYAIF